MRGLLTHLVSLMIFLLPLSSSSVVEPSTKTSFPDSVNDSPLIGVGVRKKGPIKVYGEWSGVLIAREDVGDEESAENQPNCFEHSQVACEPELMWARVGAIQSCVMDCTR